MKLSCELQLRRLSYSSNQGPSVTVGLHEDDWDKLKGCEGKRFMAVWVEIGADELPVGDNLTPAPTIKESLTVQRETVVKESFTTHPVGPLCKLAVLWCKDERFWRFLTFLSDEEYLYTSEEDAKMAIFASLGIDSRKEIDDGGENERAFNETFRIPFMKWLEKNGNNY